MVGIQGEAERASRWSRVEPKVDGVYDRRLMRCPVGRLGVRSARIFSSVAIVKFYHCKVVRLNSCTVDSCRVVEI